MTQNLEVKITKKKKKKIYKTVTDLTDSNFKIYKNLNYNSD